ncbi:MAG: DMT family transporter [Verrucomicrobiota bacterium]|jgi:drug/metabolite transporter (DMT)-like permease|nr:DMT family transporter [Verrucomicrobiota bacterium]
MQHRFKPEHLGFLSILAGASCIGLAPIWVRLSELGPVATAFHRLLLALPFLWLWQIWSPVEQGTEGDQNHSMPSMVWFALAGLMFALDMAFWHESLHHTSVANATLLTNVAPVFVTIAARFLFNEQIPKWFLLGMGFTLVGAILLSGASLNASKDHLYGDLIAIVAAVFYAAYMLSLKQLRRYASTAQVLARTAPFSALVLGLIAWFLDEPMVPESTHGWGILIALAFTGQVLGQGLIAYGFKHLTASLSSVSLLLQPLVAAIAAWILLKESMVTSQLLGGVIILAGIFLARRSSLRP